MKALEEEYYRVPGHGNRGTVAIHVGDWCKSSRVTNYTKDSKHPAVISFLTNTKLYHEVLEKGNNGSIFFLAHMIVYCTHIFCIFIDIILIQKMIHFIIFKNILKHNISPVVGIIAFCA